MRYEIKDIKPPDEIRRSMELQAESERIKRSTILTSEGERQSKINIAEGVKAGYVLQGEGRSNKIFQEARGICESLEKIAEVIESGGCDGKGQDALRLKLTEQYILQMRSIIDSANIMILPTSGNSNGVVPSGNDISSLSNSQIATFLATYKGIVGQAGNAKLSSDDILE
jgi:regulator of protease activity HflC (stomatin/prohibitin superfamily)